MAEKLSLMGVEAFPSVLASNLAWCRDKLIVATFGDDLGAFRRNLDLLSCEVTGYLHVAKDNRIRSLVHQYWPDARFGSYDDDSISVELTSVVVAGAHASVDILACTLADLAQQQWLEGQLQGPRGVRVASEKLQALTSGLKDSHPQLSDAIVAHGRPAAVGTGDEAAAFVAAALGLQPIDADMQVWGPVRCPRRFWVDFPLVKECIPRFIGAGPCPEWAERLEKGGKRGAIPPPGGLPAYVPFTNPCGGLAPPPAFLKDAVERWEQHKRCLPPIHFLAEYMVKTKDGYRLRMPKEMMCTLGFAWCNADPVERKKKGVTMSKSSLVCAIARALAAPLCGFIIAQALHFHGLLKVQAELYVCWGRPAEELGALANANLGEGHRVAAQTQLHHCVLGQFVWSAAFSGSDVRIADQTLRVPKSSPRQAIDSSRWVWKVVLSVPYDKQHINILELKAVIMSLQWRLRHPVEVGRRHVHLSYSQISIAVLVKARISARTLCKAVRRYQALCLVASIWPYFIFVSTSANLAGAPSRWPLKRGD